MKKIKAEVLYVKLASTSKDVQRFNAKIGKGIRAVRESLGLSQSALAEKAKFCRNTLVQIELGQRKTPISLKTVYKLLDALVVPITLDEFLELCRLT